jgi:hypothetical protein
MFNESIENLLRLDTTIHVPLAKHQHMINQQCCYYKLIKPDTPIHVWRPYLILGYPIYMPLDFFAFQSFDTERA